MPDAKWSPERQSRRSDLTGVWGSILSSTVRIRNVSLGGISIETHEALSVGRTYKLRIGEADGGQVLNIEVTWCQFMGTEIGEKGDVVPVFQAGARSMPDTSDDSGAERSDR